MQKVQIVLVGKCGQGKSATGNTILQRLHFNYSPSLTSITKMVERGIKKTNNLELHVFDTPGPYETDYNDKPNEVADLEKTCQNMEGLIRSCNVNAGATVFFLIFNITCKFSAEDYKTFDAYEKIFGDNVFSDFGVLVFTHGDNFKQDFDQFLEGQSGKANEFIRKFPNRCILISNVGNFTDRSLYSETMINLAIQLKDSTNGYTLDHYIANKCNRSNFIMESKVSNLRSDIFQYEKIPTAQAEKFTRELAKLQIEVDENFEGTDLHCFYKNELKRLKKELNSRLPLCTIL